MRLLTREVMLTVLENRIKCINDGDVEIGVAFVKLGDVFKELDILLGFGHCPRNLVKYSPNTLPNLCYSVSSLLSVNNGTREGDPHL